MPVKNHKKIQPVDYSSEIYVYMKKIRGLK